MTREQVLKRVRTALAQRLGADMSSITEDTHYTDLPGEERDPLDLGMAVEDEFDLEISPDDSQHWHTVGAIVDYICQRIG